MASTGYIDIDIVADSRGVDAMLALVETAVSFPGMSAFLGGVVDPYLRQRAAARFASEGDDASGAWEPLQPSTVEIRESQGFPGAHPINHRTGALEAYVTGTQGAISFDAGFTTLELPGREGAGTLKSKYEVAQKGSPPRRRHMATPPRPVLAMDNSDFVFVMAQLAFFIQTAGMAQGMRAVR